MPGRAELLLLLGSFVCPACGRAPEDSVSDAKRAHEEAVEAEAARYSPDSLAMASKALETALSEVERQRRKAAPLRDYSHARVLLGQARHLARGARYEALARRDAIRTESAAILETASRQLAAFEAIVPSRDMGSDEWAAWIRRFRAASDALAEAHRAFREGDYVDAKARGTHAVEQLHAMQASVPSS